MAKKWIVVFALTGSNIFSINRYDQIFKSLFYELGKKILGSFKLVVR